MFDGRMEISNPGKPPPPIALARLRFGLFSPDDLVARELVELGYIEEVGLGIRRMREEATRLYLPDPQFCEDGLRFVVTFRTITQAKGSRQRSIGFSHFCSKVSSATDSTAGCCVCGSAARLRVGSTWR